MPLKLYIYFILCTLIYLVFNYLTIIFQVPRLLLWQFPGPLPPSPYHLAQHHPPAIPDLRWVCDLSVVIYCLSTFPEIFHDQSAKGVGRDLYGQDVGVNFVRSTLWVGLQSCLGDFVYCLCFESPRCWCQCVTDIGCFPVSFPCQISEEVGFHACSFPGPSPWVAPGPQSRNSLSLCQDISLTPAILLVLLHAGVSTAEDNWENVLAKKKTEEEQERLELTVLGNW